LSVTAINLRAVENLPKRIKEHQEKRYQGSFSARYNANKLVYYEAFQMIGDAISKEKQIKAGSRAKKIAIINSVNAEWNDLYDEIVGLFG
jgi:putative endonuclease